MVVLELPVPGWRAPFFEEDDQRWVLAGDYPLNGRTALRSHGVGFADNGVLRALSQQLQRDPRPLLNDLAPPFSLVWSSKDAGETFVQNDGLGQSQLFELEGERLWAVSNKIFPGGSIDRDAVRGSGHA